MDHKKNRILLKSQLSIEFWLGCSFWSVSLLADSWLLPIYVHFSTYKVNSVFYSVHKYEKQFVYSPFRPWLMTWGRSSKYQALPAKVQTNYKITVSSHVINQAETRNALAYHEYCTLQHSHQRPLTYTVYVYTGVGNVIVYLSLISGKMSTIGMIWRLLMYLDT